MIDTTNQQTEKSQGFLLIDKPAGMTSHDVVDRIRRYSGIRKVGHAGTLDPFATGLLIVGVGRAATKEMQKLVGLDKKYEAEFLLGASSDTDDKKGVIEDAPLTIPFTPEALKSFIGEIDQIPPSYSAIKIGGKKMYEQARKGTPMKAEARRITIHSIDLVSEDPLRVSIHSSSGTYIRAIARDLGKSLGGGGYVEELRRTAIGPFSIEQSHPLDWFEKQLPSALIPVNEVLGRL